MAFLVQNLRFKYTIITVIILKIINIVLIEIVAFIMIVVKNPFTVIILIRVRVRIRINIIIQVNLKGFTSLVIVVVMKIWVKF